MILLTPEFKKLIAPGIRQRVCNECRKFLIDLSILSPNMGKPPRAIKWCYKRRYIQSLLDKLGIVHKIRQPASIIPCQSTNFLIPKDYF